MSFSEAILYPFQNLAKVLSIVLALTIAFAVFIALVLNAHDWSALLGQFYGFEHLEAQTEPLGPMGGGALLGVAGLLLVAILSGFWLSGYSVEVVRSVMFRDEAMPAIDFTRNLKDGAALFVSSLAYWCLFILLSVGLVMLGGILGGIGALGSLILIPAFLCFVAAICVMGWAYFVGMARFAAEGDHRASWQVRRNIGLARQNWRSGAKLLLYLILLSFIFGFVRQVADMLLAGSQAALIASVTLTLITYYFFNLMQHFSTQHLIAQYALAIGIGADIVDHEDDKDKVGFV